MAAVERQTEQVLLKMTASERALLDAARGDEKLGPWAKRFLFKVARRVVDERGGADA